MNSNFFFLFLIIIFSSTISFGEVFFSSPPSLLILNQNPTQPKSKAKIVNQTKLIDARSRERWLKKRLPKSIYIDWDHLSQPGVGSRGSLRENPQILADDFARMGLSPTDTVYIYGDGQRGSGAEGRLAWTLHWLGFKKIFVTNYSEALKWSQAQTESGPYVPTPTQKWSVKTDTSLIITKSEFVNLKNSSPKKIVTINLKSRSPTFLPEPYNPSDLNIYWTDFLDHEKFVKAQLDEYFIRLKLNKKETLVMPLSFAGLRSAYICLILKSWGYNSKINPEGYSIDL